MDSCQKMDIDICLMSSLLKMEFYLDFFFLPILSLTPLSYTMQTEFSAFRDVSTLSLKRITLRLNAMIPYCYVENKSIKPII